MAFEASNKPLQTALTTREYDYLAFTFLAETFLAAAFFTGAFFAAAFLAAIGAVGFGVACLMAVLIVG